MTTESETPCPYAPEVAGVVFACRKSYGHAGPHHFDNESPDFEKIRERLRAAEEVAAKVRQIERADTIAAVVAWLEREAESRDSTGNYIHSLHAYQVLRYAAKQLRDFPQVLDQPTAQEGK